MLFILLLSLTPVFLSLLLPKARERWETKLGRIRNRIRQTNHQTRITPGQYIGDISCAHNARSPYIRCAVKPSGPCHNCLDYQPR